MFDAELKRVVVENAAALLSVPGVYEAVSEHFNNEVLARLEQQRDGQPTPRCQFCGQELDEVAGYVLALPVGVCCWDERLRTVES